MLDVGAPNGGDGRERGNPFAHHDAAAPRAVIGTGSLRRAVDAAVDVEARLQAAFDHGVRSIDTAPMYDCGYSELAVGRALAAMSRDDVVVSTKVGRLVVNASDDGVGDGWAFDFSADGIRRSFDASLLRLGVDRVDIVYLHDPDDHWQAAIDEAWPVLEQLRADGVVAAVGAGMTQAPMLARFAAETTMDIFLLAGRYSLLDHSALDEFLPRCLAGGQRVLVAQMLHGGLITGQTNPQIHYGPVDDATALRVKRIREIATHHDVATEALAIQFPLGHGAVCGVVTGPTTPDQVRQNLRWLSTNVPAEAWSDLVAEGIIDAAARLPVGLV